MSIMGSLRVAACIAAGSVLIACAKHPPPATAQAPAQSQASRPATTGDNGASGSAGGKVAAAGARASEGSEGRGDRGKEAAAGAADAGPARLAVDPDIAKRCRLMARPVELGLGANAKQDRAKLRRLADCLNLPPFDQTAIKLIEGEGERAKRIREILVDNGVAADRIKVAPDGSDAPASSKEPDSKADVTLVTEATAAPH